MKALTCLLLATLACAEPGPEPINAAGNWNNVQGGLSSVLRVTLTDTDGAIGGYAKINSTPDSVSVTGTRTGTTLNVVLGFRNPATFEGRIWSPEVMTLHWVAVRDSATFRRL